MSNVRHFLWCQMIDPVLGMLQPSPRDAKLMEGKIAFGDSTVTIGLDADVDDLAKTISLAVRVVENIHSFDEEARAKATKDLLGTYNDNWRNEDEPILSESEFKSKLLLTHIGFLGTTGIDMFYNDGELFGGHSIIPQSFDGITFTYTQMYG
jgi:hypothetical protein